MLIFNPFGQESEGGPDNIPGNDEQNAGQIWKKTNFLTEIRGENKNNGADYRDNNSGWFFFGDFFPQEKDSAKNYHNRRQNCKNWGVDGRCFIYTPKIEK